MSEEQQVSEKQQVSAEKQQMLEKKQMLEKQQVPAEKQQMLEKKQVSAEKQQVSAEKQQILEKKQIKMAYIDVNFVVNQSKEIRELQQVNAAKNKDLQVWISTVKTDIIKQATPQEQQLLLNRYNAELAQKQELIKIEHNLKLQEIDKHITDLIAEEAKKLDYDFIFAKGSLLYGGEDITLQIADLVK